MFVGLVQRHEQSFYSFVHKVHAKGEGLFDDLIRWIELFINFMRDGLRDPVSLEFLLPHTGPDRLAIMQEVDAVALYHYRLKVAHENKIRRRFVREGDPADDEDDEATRALVDDVVKGLSFGDLIEGDAEDLAAEDSTDESGSEGETDNETDSYEDAREDLSIHHSEKPLLHTNSKPPSPRPQSKNRSSAETDTPPAVPPKDHRHLPRKRSISLRSSKSATDLRHKQKTTSMDVPSVPPLPPNIAALSLVDSLPSNPKHGLTHIPSKPSDDMTDKRSRLRSKKPSPSKSASDIKPPDLKALPNLVPLFIEMAS